MEYVRNEQVSAAVCPPEYRGRAFAVQQVITCLMVVLGSLGARHQWSNPLFPVPLRTHEGIQGTHYTPPTPYP